MKGFRTITLLARFAVILAACGAQPTAQVIVETQIVEVTSEPVRSDGLPAYTGGPTEIRMGWSGNDDRAARTLRLSSCSRRPIPRSRLSASPMAARATIFRLSTPS